MNITVIVRKQKGIRYAGQLFLGILWMIPVMIWMYCRDVPMALVSGIPFALFLPVLLYCETWQIRFGASAVEKQVFFWTERHSYAQIREAVKGYYTSENGWCIRMYFADGKCWKFRLNDENGEQVERQLQKHCSIRIRS